MCFGGGSAKAPEIKYVGPSEDDIQRNQQSLQTFTQQMNEQQAQFQAALQAQIDQANQEYTALEKQYAGEVEGAKQAGADAASAAQANRQAAANTAAADLSSAAAAGAASQASAYKVGTTTSEPVNTQETKAITDKKKPKSSLKITQNAVEASAGTGLNIGV